jgi:methionine salvage enolase-phosphatase E1
VTGIESYDYAPLSIEMEIKPIKGLLPGNYTVTIGARYETVSYSKIIDLVAKK